jgi:hypothetical protein
VWVINDSAQPVAGTLIVKRLGFDGKVHGQLQAEVAIKAGEAQRCLAATELGEISLRSQFLQATFAGRDACCPLIAERYLHLPDAHLNVHRDRERLEITTDKFARQVTLQMTGVSGAVFEDNYFDLVPGQTKSVSVVRAAGGRQLTVRALNAAPLTLTWEP